MQFMIKGKTFSNLVKACAVACNHDDIRKNLQHVELVVKDGRLTATCLDGFRLVQKTTEVSADAEAGKCLVKPKQLISALALAGLKNDVRVTLEGDYLRIEYEFGVISLCKLDNDFIDCEKIWPSPDRESTSIWVNAKYLAEVAKAMISDSDNMNCMIGLDIPLDPNAPIIITKHDGKALVLPIRNNVRAGA